MVDEVGNPASTHPARPSPAERRTRTNAQDIESRSDSAAPGEPDRTAAGLQRLRHVYNDERPHDTLDGRTPGSLYQPSPREYSRHLPPFDYPGHFIVKRITNAGTFRFKKKLLFIANALKQYTIGLEEIDDGIWSIHFCNVLLGRIDERDYIIRD